MKSLKSTHRSAIEFPSNSASIDYSKTYTWQIWLLRISSKGVKTQIRTLYSWIVPNSISDNGWLSYAADSIELDGSSTKSLNVEVLKADFVGTGNVIKHCINGLMRGEYLSEIMTEESRVPNYLTNWTLVQNDGKQILADTYLVRPEVFLPVDHLLIPWQHKTTPNPIDYSIFVNQLFYLSKENLFVFDDFAINEIGKMKIIDHCRKVIKIDTGFNITRSSAPRLGNFEWFVTPLSDRFLKPLVSFYVSGNRPAESNNLCVELKPLVGQVKEILLRCRTINGEEVTLDEIRQLVWTDQMLQLQFTSGEPISEAQLTIWERSGEDSFSRIIFEQSFIYLRTSTWQMQVIGSQINSGEISLLDKLQGKKELSKKTSLAKYSRSTAAGESTIGGYKMDPWVSSSRKISEIMGRLFPEKSDAQFFSAGWDKNIERSGQLSFFEWILEKISITYAGSLMLLDPFLDKDGIEIFANSRTTNAEFHLVTCTQHRERTEEIDVKQSTGTGSDVTINTGKLTKAALNIQNACKQMHPLLRGLSLTITDLRSNDLGKKQIFHDRYLLLFNRDKQVIKGYNLSNSLQGATRKAPLLVTPIPYDVLSNVCAYVDELLTVGSELPSAKKIEHVILYPEVKESESSKFVALDASTQNCGPLSRIPDAGFLFSMLFDRGDFLHADLNTLYTELKMLNLYVDGRDTARLCNVSSSIVFVLSQKLNVMDDLDFLRLFNALGELIARSEMFKQETLNGVKHIYDFFQEFAKHVETFPRIAAKLIKYLKGYADQRYPRDRERIWQIFNSNSFQDALDISYSYLSNMGPDFFGIKYGYYYACKLLVRCFPTEARSLLESLVAAADKAEWNEGNDKVRNVLMLISAIAHRLFITRDPENQKIWLQSTDYRIRAAVAVSCFHSAASNIRDFSFDNLQQLWKSSLAKDEYIQVMAFYNANLRLKGHAQNGVIIRKTFHEVVENTPSNELIMVTLIEIFAGRLKNNWSYTISLNFLDPLIKNGRLAVLWCFNYWNLAFLSKLKFKKPYISSGSDTLQYHYCETTDVELTQTLIYYYGRMDSQNKLQKYQEWCTAIDMFWTIIRHPFARHNNHNGFSSACERVIWLVIITEILLNVKNQEVRVKMVLESFLNRYHNEITYVRAHLGENTRLHILSLSGTVQSF
ncbi:VPA1262 family N-terminal domain-containing protein [Sphingobacterium bambusae]|uniref:VPA1262 family N-terminal domain-containing protein n=1 Tax=Sphingobacterium bambusae TaxID=662858 RepID=A0ABW6BCI8_9SPHI|nr:VPA1262 family N-terminal domain-containing protein [Sphingobacterium bambusae]WPL48457.1 VPA1262 family N-terminal domain-containing protein [Sphingobacterium bambusae]